MHLLHLHTLYSSTSFITIWFWLPVDGSTVRYIPFIELVTVLSSSVEFGRPDSFASIYQFCRFIVLYQFVTYIVHHIVHVPSHLVHVHRSLHRSICIEFVFTFIVASGSHRFCSSSTGIVDLEFCRVEVLSSPGSFFTFLHRCSSSRCITLQYITSIFYTIFLSSVEFSSVDIVASSVVLFYTSSFSVHLHTIECRSICRSTFTYLSTTTSIVHCTPHLVRYHLVAVRFHRSTSFYIDRFRFRFRFRCTWFVFWFFCTFDCIVFSGSFTFYRYISFFYLLHLVIPSSTSFHLVRFLHLVLHRSIFTWLHFDWFVFIWFWFFYRITFPELSIPASSARFTHSST